VKLLPRLLRYLRPYVRQLVLAIVATFVFAALDAMSFVLLIPFVGALFHVAEIPGGTGGIGRFVKATVGRVVDLDGDPLVAIQGIILMILVVITLKNVVDFFRSYLVARIEQGVTRDLRNDTYDHVLELDLGFFGRTRMGQITTRLTSDVDSVRALITHEFFNVLTQVVALLVTVRFMVMASGRLTVAAFVVVPGTMGVWGPLVKRLRKGDRRVLDISGEVSSHIQETLAGVRLVKASAAEAHERSRFHGLTESYFTTFVRTERLRALAAPLTEMLAAVGTVVLLWYGARLVVVEGALTGAEFFGFLALSLKLYAPVKYLAKLPAMTQPGLVAADRVFEFLDAPIEVADRPGARPFPGLEREIRFDRVSFAYRAGEPVLDNVDLVVPRGAVVALVGPSGAGKSTLMDLLGRFYDPTSGRITIDGTDIRDLQVRSLRTKLGVVSQETVLFHDTVRANIAYGINATDAEVERAARAAHAHEFVSALPKAYETVVGERGTQLSGGQRQRIAIARAILRDPPILVFDEATSALDSESERLVQQATQRLLAGRTVFVIAHRLSTIQRADQIVVLDQGRIVERGDHAGLLEQRGLYRRLYELQFDEHPLALGS
jgi:ATP-binding cassette, subfamily B, bacterial MsbA